MYSPRIVQFCSGMTSPSTDVLSDQYPATPAKAGAHFGHGSRPAPGWRNGSSYLPLLFQDALVEVAHDHPGQPFVMDEETLADRVGVLLGNLERLLQDLVGAEAAIDEPLDIADPVLDDLAL